MYRRLNERIDPIAIAEAHERLEHVFSAAFVAREIQPCPISGVILPFKRKSRCHSILGNRRPNY